MTLTSYLQIIFKCTYYSTVKYNFSFCATVFYRSAYAASKHALQSFCDCLRAEVAQYNIKVTVVSPGYIRTNLSLNALTASGQKYGGKYICSSHLEPSYTNSFNEFQF